MKERVARECVIDSQGRGREKGRQKMGNKKRVIKMEGDR